MTRSSLVWALLDTVGFDEARYWPSLEKLTIRGWSGDSDHRYLAGFVKGLVKWHGRRIQEIKIFTDNDWFIGRLTDTFKEVEVVPFDIILV
jgi:hypothetical protein